MYARCTTVLAKRESIDAGIAHIRDMALPALQRMDGFIGLSLLVNRDACRCVLTCSWESKVAMRAPAGPVGVIRDRAVETLGGTMWVTEWEILVMHRDRPAHPVGCARGTLLRMRPADIDRAVDIYKMVSIPALKELDGFRSASLLVERASGAAMSTETYDSREAMQRNREQADAIQYWGNQETGAQVDEVREFEVALAHLRVPEMA